MMPSSIDVASENFRPGRPVGFDNIDSINDHGASESNWNRDTIPGSQPGPATFVRHALYAARPVWAAHVRAADSGTAEDRAAADQLTAEWVEEYAAGATWYALSDSPRGIVYRNQWNDSTWLIYDADRDSIETAEVTR